MAVITKKENLISDNNSIKEEDWTILEEHEKYYRVPTKLSDLAIEIDSIKIYKLLLIRDTGNYDSELKLQIREPLPTNEPVVLIDGRPDKYGILSNYYRLDDVKTFVYYTGKQMIESGVQDKGQAKNGLIIVTTKNPKR